MILPDLLLVEIANALRFNKELKEEDVKPAVDSLLNMEMNVIVPSREILEKAVKAAFELDLTVYDSVYLAMSDVLKCTLITEDLKLAKTAVESLT